ncbi:MAG: hypothetical protein M1817_005486 [Caeruleum heppii]|nr:MAG: hypothetical protein M1817_005486 [Caeruleum heppii]
MLRNRAGAPSSEASEAARISAKRFSRSSSGSPSKASTTEHTPAASDGMTTKTPWIPLAVASGACAAFNGVFAKLTTTELTGKMSGAIAAVFGLSRDNRIVESFFILNLVFNGIMWALFTTALARGSSTTRVSIINTSSNFMITAFLGLAIFSESLPPLWWLGAALLVAGNVIIGRREEEDKPPIVGVARGARAVEAALDSASGEEQDDLLGDVMELDDESKTDDEVDDPL